MTLGGDLPDIRPHDCVYATRGWGIHDERWVAALLEIGRSPFVVAWTRDETDALEFREQVAQAAQGGLPVLAGPLDTVAPVLTGLGLPVVGLSWGYDLTNADARGDDLSWISALSGVIVDSVWNQDIVVRAGMDPARVTYLPWGVDLQTFVFHGPWIDAFELGVPPHAPLVVSLRAHEELYRVEDIIRAFAAVPRRLDVHEDFPDPYLIIGHEGSLTDSLKAVCRELGIQDRVRFIGRVSETELVPLLGRAACYVTASEVDGTSVTLLQAMACGTPVVASATHGNLDWVRAGETGYTFPTADVGALADVLVEVTARYPIAMVERARHEVQERADWHANLGRLRRALQTAESASGA